MNIQKNDDIEDLKKQNETLKLRIKEVDDLKFVISELRKENKENKKRYISTYKAETSLIRKNKKLKQEIESLMTEKYGYEQKLQYSTNELKSQRLTIGVITVALGSFVLLRHFKLI